MDAIQITNLTKYYGKNKGIEGLSLTVTEGEFFGFIGPNGAGKSTTIRTLLGLIAPTEGAAMVLGHDVAKDNLAIRNQVGYLPSEAMFHAGMKVKDILRLSADLRKMDCSKESAILCERLQLDTSRKVEELSFGNRKKVAIVCALQHHPKLLILDEPTGGLDPLMQKEFFDILQERNRQGATIFLSSHVLSEIQRNCSRAAIIRDGKIIACDSVEALSNTSAKRVTLREATSISDPEPTKTNSITHGTSNTAQGSHNLNTTSVAQGSHDLNTTNVAQGSHDLNTTNVAQGNCLQESIRALSGIRDLTVTGDNLTFLYSGDINQLIRTLSAYPVADLMITEPDLEEIFLHYYEKEDQAG